MVCCRKGLQVDHFFFGTIIYCVSEFISSQEYLLANSPVENWTFVWIFPVPFTHSEWRPQVGFIQTIHYNVSLL